MYLEKKQQLRDEKKKRKKLRSEFKQENGALRKSV